jgi:A/G-specific adenine glycosylase
MQLTSSEIRKFHKKILEWYAVHKRDLPWRHTRDPYKILVSEIMLQQTQVPRVIPKYEIWLEKLPTIESLAKAKTSEVLSLWSGLGYNRRALNLKKTAEIIGNVYKGNFPDKEKELLKLPGIGKYTARAILSFAFDKQVAVVDTNVRKVILTKFRNIKEKEIQSIADQILPKGKAYDWNHALMDYASTVLKREILQSRTKQSKFVGSNRYYRGKILKLLLKQKRIKIEELGLKIKEDYTKDDEKRLWKIIEDLRSEGFITIKNNIITIVS